MSNKEREDLILAIKDIQYDLDRSLNRLTGNITEYLFDVQRFHRAVNECLNDLIKLLEDSE